MKRNLSSRRGKFNQSLSGALALLMVLLVAGIAPRFKVGAAAIGPDFVIPDSGVVGNSTINVAGIAGTITSVTVTLTTYTAFRPDDTEFLLVAPNGTSNLEFLSDAGGNSPVGPVTMTFSDSGATFVPDAGPLTSSIYKPGEYSAVEVGSDFGLPALTINHAQTNGAATFATAFNGGAPNGVWTLYYRDDTTSGDVGATVAKWSLTINGTTAASSTVGGRVLDNSGSPVAGAVVNLSGTQNRKFITDSNGDYLFDNVETNGFYTVRPARANFGFSPAERSFSQLGNSTDAAFTAVPTGGRVNPLDTPEFFVRQNYLDFLGREPDESGFNFWSDQILSCGSDNACIGRRTVNVSAAYFLSIEFQQTGGLVDGLYRASYGRQPQYAEFMPDTRTVAQNLVVGRTGWEQLLAANKQAFVDAFVNRPAFIGVYGNMDNNAYVDTLISHTGVAFTSGDRDALVNGLDAGTMTRANVLRSIAENKRFVNAKLNETFVMMEYFGYLRRDPDASGYQFWLNKLNQFGGNFEQAEMVKAFIVSGEYRDRFAR